MMTPGKSQEAQSSNPLSAGKRSEEQKKTVEPRSKNSQTTEIPKSRGLSKDEQAVDKELEKTLQRLPGYHGYLPREDLGALLLSPGDYLIRVSETDINDQPQDGQRMRQVVVSVLQEDGKDFGHLIIRQKQNKYFIVPRKQFDTVQEVIEDNKKKPRKLSSNSTATYLFRRPIPLGIWEFKHVDVQLCNKQLGRGAFGVVQLGELTKIDGSKVPVAIKSSRGEVDLSKDQIRELMNEARLVRGLKHKNVVRTFGVAVDEQPLFIIIEYVDGPSLDKFIVRNKDSLTLEDRLSMILGAARGLDYLHSVNLVHCDISARNCLIVSVSKRVKISDFGLSAPLKENEVLSRKDQSTPVRLPIKWLSPETLAELRFTHKTDVYSFGILTFEIFTSTEPYAGMENKDVKPLVLEAKAPAFPSFVPPLLDGFYRSRIFAKDEKMRVRMKDIIPVLVRFGAKDPSPTEAKK